jgi:adenosylcobinamide-GDP ribazoletransferase
MHGPPIGSAGAGGREGGDRGMRWDPLLAVEFLTVVRLRPWRPVPPPALARAQAFYPLVGLALGGVLALTDAALASSLPRGARAAALVAVLAVATRGLHLDGLADTFDGLLGGRDAAGRLAIMRDPRVGAFGAAAIALVLLLKWSALAELGAPLRRPGLLLFPALGRLAMVVTAAAVPYARAEGLGAGYHAAARGAPLVMATLTALAACSLALHPAGLVLAAVAAGVALGVGAWARALLGGATGDVYGATCELAETVVLLTLLAGAAHGWFAPWLVRG